jgi:hypothetical protein
VKKSNLLYLVDFGISKAFLEADKKTHKEMSINEEFNGNLIFCSKYLFQQISKGLYLFIFWCYSIKQKG